MFNKLKRIGLGILISSLFLCPFQVYAKAPVDNADFIVQPPKNEIKEKQEGMDIVQYANQFVGNPYRWGGNSLINGCDCSHFVWNVLKDTGHYDGEYRSSSHWRGLGQKVDSLEQAIAGDVIVYSGHVAIYDGQGCIIEAQNYGVGITNNRSVQCSYIIAIRRF